MNRAERWGILFSSGPCGYVVGAVIALQVTVPAIALFHEPPARFGFQMYSAQGGAEVTALDQRGVALDIDLGSMVAGSLRPELNWMQALPDRICQQTPEAMQVIVEQDERKSTVLCD
ncbi:hypothetical protein [Kocuria sp. CNJ-770]|uniref:hypothetical protein n=1 Tax=Kocuria sp. CNJ-770 TaxID=1904964 RepID=UPI0011150A7D|nr:hypothetical protein [Kocuria sp. CNJ-770]